MPATSQGRGPRVWQGRRAGCERIESPEIASWSTPRSRGDLRAAGEPIFVGLEFHAELLVVDAQIAVAATRDGVGHHGLHFLGDDTDECLVAAKIAEAIEAETVVEMAEQHDVM